MKNIKNNTNNTRTKKVVKPAYVVNLVGATGEWDTTLRFALCKYENNIDDFTTGDVCAIMDYIKTLSMVCALNTLINSRRVYVLGCGSCFTTDELNGTVTECRVAVRQKKPSIFKRFWNWITRKK
jgi:hypothetical protein